MLSRQSIWQEPACTDTHGGQCQKVQARARGPRRTRKNDKSDLSQVVSACKHQVLPEVGAPWIYPVRSPARST